MNLSELRASFKSVSGENGLSEAQETTLANESCRFLETRNPTGPKIWQRDLVPNESTVFVPNLISVESVTKIDTSGSERSSVALSELMFKREQQKRYMLSPGQTLLENGEFLTDPAVDGSWTASGGNFDGAEGIYWDANWKALQVEAYAGTRSISQTLKWAKGRTPYNIYFHITQLWEYSGAAGEAPTITFDIGSETEVYTVETTDGWKRVQITTPEEELIGAGDGLFNLTITFASGNTHRIDRFDMREVPVLRTVDVGSPVYWSTVNSANTIRPINGPDKLVGEDQLGMSLFLYPVANAITSVEVLGQMYPRELLSGTDENYWTKNWSSAVVVAMQMTLATQRGEGTFVVELRRLVDTLMETLDRSKALDRSRRPGRFNMRGGRR